MTSPAISGISDEYQVAAAAEEQNAVVEHVNQSINAIREVSGQTAMSTEQISRSSQDLTQLAVDLQSKISHFKIA
ncbi:MAG: hypothetical protein U1F34_01190 [Gammaproteobacteria bacterium]